MNNKTRNIIFSNVLAVSLVATPYFGYQLYKTAEKSGQERPKIIQEYNNAKSTLNTLNYELGKLETIKLPYRSKEVIELEEKIFQPQQIELKKDLENTIIAVKEDIKTMKESNEYKEYERFSTKTGVKFYTNLAGMAIFTILGFFSYTNLPYPLRKKYNK